MAALNVPYSFVDATQIVASQMNSNFTAVKTFVDNLSNGTNIDAGSIAASKLASYPKLMVPHTFSVGGVVAVPNGQIDYINPFFVKVPPYQTVKLSSVRYRINSGTSATVKLQINGVDATGFTGLTVTTTVAETDPADVTLNNNDLISLVVTAVSGTPVNMSVTVFLEYTWVG
jgi:hypothetical protein